MAFSVKWPPSQGTGAYRNAHITPGLAGNGLIMISYLSTKTPLSHTSDRALPSDSKLSVPVESRYLTTTPRTCVKVQASTETLHLGGQSLEAGSSAGKLNIVLEAAKTEEKLRIAATLRARSFYTYPEGRSKEALKVHQKMKAEEEWETLTRKVGGLEPGYKHTTCVIALCPPSDMSERSTDLCSCCKITSSSAEEYILVGTLDINQGLVLPGEIPGEHPQGPDAGHRRAYVSNVCVAQEVRRRGVGLVLMQYVKKTVKLWGVSDLYVHVVVDNMSARQLYEKAGFLYEKEETLKEARSLSRPRRFLLRTQL